MKKHSKRYGLADFGRYSRGDMSKKEQHAFEKALLDDPFLQDAYDGLVRMQDDGTALESALTRLQGALSTRVAVGRSKKRWAYRIVASIALFVGCYFLIVVRIRHEHVDPQMGEGETMELPVGIYPGSLIERTESRRTESEVLAHRNTDRDSFLLNSKRPRATAVRDPLVVEDTTERISKRVGEEIRVALMGGEKGEWLRADGISSGGQVIVVVPDSAFRNDTLAQDTLGLAPEKMKRWKEYLQQATRGVLRYGEGVRFGMLRDGKVVDLTPAQLDSLEKVYVEQQKK
jgi:hypothetical protein